MQSFDLESLSLQPFLQSLHKEQWQEVRLGEVAEMNNGKARPKNYGDYPIYGGNGILGYGNQYNCDSETIIVGRVGAYCGCVYYEKQPIWVSDNAIIVKAKSENNIKFLYYVLKSMKLNDYALGSSHPLLTQNLLNTLQVEIPKDITTQQKIAEILSSFDDKIDLLHRQNKTLESLALTLFRHYFIDNPKRNEWELGKLGDYVKIVYGKNLPTKNLLPQGYAVFGGNGKIGYFDQYLYDEPQVLISCRGEASGKVNISERKSFITNNSLVLERTKDKEITFEYLKYYCLSYNFDTFVSGSAQPQITIDGLYSAEFIKANQNDILKFSRITSNFENKIENNSKQIQNLQAMRDMLLKAIFA